MQFQNSPEKFERKFSLTFLQMLSAEGIWRRLDVENG